MSELASNVEEGSLLLRSLGKEGLEGTLVVLKLLLSSASLEVLLELFVGNSGDATLDLGPEVGLHGDEEEVVELEQNVLSDALANGLEEISGKLANGRLGLLSVLIAAISGELAIRELSELPEDGLGGIELIHATLAAVLGLSINELVEQILDLVGEVRVEADVLNVDVLNRGSRRRGRGRSVRSRSSANALLLRLSSEHLLGNIVQTLHDVDSAALELLDQGQEGILSLMLSKIGSGPSVVGNVVNLVDTSSSSNIVQRDLRDLSVVADSLKLGKKTLELLSSVDVRVPERNAPLVGIEGDGVVVDVEPFNISLGRLLLLQSLTRNGGSSLASTSDQAIDSLQELNTVGVGDLAELEGIEASSLRLEEFESAMSGLLASTEALEDLRDTILVRLPDAVQDVLAKGVDTNVALVTLIVLKSLEHVHITTPRLPDLLLVGISRSLLRANLGGRKRDEEGLGVGDNSSKETVDSGHGVVERELSVELGVGKDGTRQVRVDLLEDLDHADLGPLVGLFDANEQTVGRLGNSDGSLNSSFVFGRVLVGDTRCVDESHVGASAVLVLDKHGIATFLGETLGQLSGQAFESDGHIAIKASSMNSRVTLEGDARLGTVEVVDNVQVERALGDTTESDGVETATNDSLQEGGLTMASGTDENDFGVGDLSVQTETAKSKSSAEGLDEVIPGIEVDKWMHKPL